MLKSMGPNSAWPSQPISSTLTTSPVTPNASGSAASTSTSLSNGVSSMNSSSFHRARNVPDSYLYKPNAPVGTGANYHRYIAAASQSPFTSAISHYDSSSSPSFMLSSAEPKPGLWLPYNPVWKKPKQLLCSRNIFRNCF